LRKPGRSLSGWRKKELQPLVVGRRQCHAAQGDRKTRANNTTTALHVKNSTNFFLVEDRGTFFIAFRICTPCLLASARWAAVRTVTVPVGDVGVRAMVWIRPLLLLVVGGDQLGGLHESPRPQAHDVVVRASIGRNHSLTTWQVFGSALACHSQRFANCPADGVAMKAL